MAEEKSRFVFALSAEGTKKLQEGTLVLSSGGLRRADGSLYEMATPVCFEPNSVQENIDQKTVEEAFQKKLAVTTSGLDKSMQDIHALRDIAWLNYAVNCRTYEMTYQGFQQLIGQLDDVSAQISRVERKLDNKESNDRLELANRYKNILKSIAGYMEAKNFNASNAFLNIAATLDEIEAYLERLKNELNTGTGSDQIILKSIVFLLGPYAYVVRKYSALYYYENDCYPPNYKDWVKAASGINRNVILKRKIQYYLRVNLNCSLEDVFIDRDKVLFNLKGYVKQIDFDHLYVLQHTKEEYLSIDRQLQEKIEQKDYQIIDGHLCIEL